MPHALCLNCHIIHSKFLQQFNMFERICNKIFCTCSPTIRSHRAIGSVACSLVLQPLWTVIHALECCIGSHLYFKRIFVISFFDSSFMCLTFDSKNFRFILLPSCWIFRVPLKRGKNKYSAQCVEFDKESKKDTSIGKTWFTNKLKEERITATTTTPTTTLTAASIVQQRKFF